MTLDSHLQSALMESTSEVLEAMFFTGVLNACLPPAADEILCAELIFHGAPSGRFGIGVPAPTARLISSNFLAKEEAEVTREDVEEVLCELTNMICGSMLSRIESEARFELLHPEMLTAAPAVRSDTVISCFELEEGSITVWLSETADPLGRN